MVRPKETVLMQGNEACVWGALDAGARFYAGYPITPSSEIAELCANLMPKYNGVYLQMEDEIGSMAAITGASLSGVKSFTATSGPGFSLMQENLGMAIYAEVPNVLINVMRVGPSTGLATRPAQGDVMQAKWGTHGDHPIIALSPESVQESYELTVRAFNLSEKYRIPVILLSDEVVGHMRERVKLPEIDSLEIINRKKPVDNLKDFLPYKPDDDGVPPMAVYGDKHIVHASSSCHDETGYSNSKPVVADKLVRRLHDKINNKLEDIVQTEHFGGSEADLTIISYGCTARSAKQAVMEAQAKGLKVNLLRLITIWPFADDAVKEAIKKAKAVLVPELNLGQVVREVERLNNNGIPIHSILRIDGEMLTPEQILTKIEEVLR